MTIVREPMWDDAPRTRAQGAFRHLARFLAALGWAARLLALSVASVPSVLCHRSGRADLATQLYVTGIRTLPVITVVSLFIGMILALQVGLELRRFNQEMYLGAAVMLTLLREMGPFACGISLAACVGSAIAAELGTISVSQGFSTTLGATGVGRSTQRSVIVNFLLILMLGYMVTRVFYR